MFKSYVSHYQMVFLESGVSIPERWDRWRQPAHQLFEFSGKSPSHKRKLD